MGGLPPRLTSSFAINSQMIASTKGAANVAAAFTEQTDALVAIAHRAVYDALGDATDDDDDDEDS